MEALERRYQRMYGKEPYNVSLWNPSAKTLSRLAGNLHLPSSSRKVKTTYTFPGTIDTALIKKATTKLGFRKEIGSLVTPTGSLSILNVLYWIKASGFRRVFILCPYYFSVINNCRILGIEARKVPLESNPGRTGFVFPEKQCAKIGRRDVLWITNPVYCSGLYLDTTWMKGLKSLMNNGVTVVTDECLSINGYEISHLTGNHPRFVGIYAPHKSVCLNSEKFSIAIFDKKYQEAFYQLADTTFSCIGQSNILALKHFVSPNYDAYSRQFNDICRDTMKNLREIFKYTKEVTFDNKNKGYLANCYLPQVSANLGKNMTFMWKLMKNTGGTLIPGIHNGYSEKMGFCFRINLSRDEAHFYTSLKKIVSYLIRSADRQANSNIVR